MTITAVISNAVTDEGADRVPCEDVSLADMWPVLLLLALVKSAAARRRKRRNMRMASEFSFGLG